MPCASSPALLHRSQCVFCPCRQPAANGTSLWLLRQAHRRGVFPTAENLRTAIAVPALGFSPRSVTTEIGRLLRLCFRVSVGPRSVVAAVGAGEWRATLRRGRSWRWRVEGHALSWPQLALASGGPRSVVAVSGRSFPNATAAPLHNLHLVAGGARFRGKVLSRGSAPRSALCSGRQSRSCCSAPHRSVLLGRRWERNPGRNRGQGLRSLLLAEQPGRE